MIFGYALEDLLLFNIEALKAVHSSYLQSNVVTLYAGIAANLFLVFYLKRSLNTLFFFLGFSWVFPGYMFFIKSFQPIYWPAQYLGYFCMAMGLTLIVYSFLRREVFFPERREQIAFAALTLIPTAGSYFLNSGHLLGLGTSSFVAALGGLSLFIFQRTALARCFALVSGLWALMLVIVLFKLNSMG